MSSTLVHSEKSTEAGYRNGDFSDSSDAQLEANSPPEDIGDKSNETNSPRNVHGVKVSPIIAAKESPY